jgi:hypothetical protein
MLKVGGATSESLEPKRTPSDVPAMNHRSKRERVAAKAKRERDLLDPSLCPA